MLDPYSRVFRPDTQANDQVQLPQWQPMGESDQGEQFTQASGTIADLLKKRMAARRDADTGNSLGNAMGSGMAGSLSGGGGGASL